MFKYEYLMLGYKLIVTTPGKFIILNHVVVKYIKN